MLDDAKKLLDILESEVLDIVNKNLNNWVAMQKSTNNRIVSNTLTALRSNAVISQLIKTITGSDVPAEKDILAGDTLSYDSIEVLLQQVRAKATPEQLAELTKLLEEAKDKTLKEIYDSIPEDRRKKHDFHFKNQLLQSQKWYGKLPESQIINLVRWSFDPEFKDTDKKKYERLHKFSKDGDVLALELGLSTIKGLTDVDRIFLAKLLDLHYRVTSLRNLIDKLSNSKLDEAKLLDLKLKLDLERAPSLQQNIVIQDVLNFLQSTTTSKDYDN